MKEDTINLFIKKKPTAILTGIQGGEEVYALQLAEDLDITYAHTVRVIKKMEALGLAEHVEKGRKNIINLTEYGEELANNLTQFRNTVKEFEEVEV